MKLLAFALFVGMLVGVPVALMRLAGRLLERGA